MDMQRDSTNPYAQCSRELSQVITKPMLESHMRPLYQHFVVVPDEDVAFTHEVQTIACSLHAQLDWRFGIVYETWPFPITKTVDCRFTSAEKHQVFAQLWVEPGCCVDAGFGAKVTIM